LRFPRKPRAEGATDRECRPGQPGSESVPVNSGGAMKYLALTFAMIAVLQSDACDPQPAGQAGQRTVIRVYCPDGDISHFLGTYNQWLAEESIQFFQVEQAGDVTVRFGTRKAAHAGEAYVLI